MWLKLLTNSPDKADQLSGYSHDCHVAGLPAAGEPMEPAIQTSVAPAGDLEDGCRLIASFALHGDAG